MGAKRLVASAWIPLIALGGVGCSSGRWGMREYRPPAVASAQGAVVRGGNGVYVVGIDGQGVRGGGGIYSGTGGNEVLVAPGRHRVCVERALADLMTSLEYSLSSKATFEHTFVAGHSYGVGYTIRFEMEDETTGERIEPLP